jgi:hypothetical protein
LLPQFSSKRGRFSAEHRFAVATFARFSHHLAAFDENRGWLVEKNGRDDENTARFDENCG